MTGYSGRSLYQKLGVKPEHNCLLVNPPDSYLEWLEADFDLLMSDGLVDFAHFFTSDRDELSAGLIELKSLIQQNGMIWVSWPKRSSKVPSTVTEDVIREICLPMGLVDVKVCSVSDVWSGLKLVIRKELRK